MNARIRTRFAPSPTGFIHLGGIYAALFTYAFAKHNNGDFILRIEDTDRSRFVEGAEEAINEALHWVGLVPDESPIKGGDYGPYRQSERLDIYKKYVQELLENGHAYYAFETQEELSQMRTEQERARKTPKYDRSALKLTTSDIEEKLARGENHVIRLKVPDDREITFTDLLRGEITIPSDAIDDQVLMKSDGFPTYHLAVVVDDHLMEISHVIRAEEWISSTPKHVLLYEMFGWDLPFFAHVPDIRDESRAKLAKRMGHASLDWYRKEGFLPQALLNYLSQQGWSHPEEKEFFDLSEFTKLFTFERMVTSAPVANLEKLTFMNGHYIREMDAEKLVKHLVDFEPELAKVETEYLKAVVTLEQERAHTLKEFVEKSKFFFATELVFTKEVLIQKGRESEETVKVLQASKELVSNCDEWSITGLETSFEKLLTEFPDFNKRDFFMTIRGAVSGQSATPPLFDMLFVLGKDRVVSRLSAAIKFLLQ